MAPVGREEQGRHATDRKGKGSTRRPLGPGPHAGQAANQCEHGEHRTAQGVPASHQRHHKSDSQGMRGGIKPVSRSRRADNHSRGHRTVGGESTDKGVPTRARRDKPWRACERNIKEARRPRDYIRTLATAGALVGMLSDGPLQESRQRAKGDTKQGHPWSRGKSNIRRSPEAQATQSDRSNHVGDQRGRHNPGIGKGDPPLDGELNRALEVEATLSTARYAMAYSGCTR